MQNQRVALNHLDCAPAFVDPKSIVKLHCADICQEQCVWRDTADLVGARQRALCECGPLRADPHRNPKRLGRLRQAQIDLFATSGTARHRRDQQWGTETFAKDADGCVDLTQIELRQRTVAEANLGKSGYDTLGANILAKDNADMVELAPFSSVAAHTYLPASCVIIAPNARASNADWLGPGSS